MEIVGISSDVGVTGCAAIRAESPHDGVCRARASGGFWSVANPETQDKHRGLAIQPPANGSGSVDETLRTIYVMSL